MSMALFIVCGIVLFVLMILLFFVVLLRRRNNYFLQEQQLAEARHEGLLLRTQVEMQEQLFSEISAEIHDNIGQGLSLVRLNLHSLRANSSKDLLSSTDDILNKAMEDLRNLSHNLNMQQLYEKGLPVATAELLQNLERTSQYKTYQYTDELFEDFTDEQTLILFRIIQEAVTNIVRHAGASHVSVEMLRAGEKNQIRIKDNGKGFQAKQLQQGLGLKNMQARAKMIGADIQINSVEGEGTEVLINMK